MAETRTLDDEAAVINVFDDSYEFTMLHRQRSKMAKGDVLPPMVKVLRQRDYAMDRDYCEPKTSARGAADFDGDGDGGNRETRLMAVDMMLLLCYRMRLGNGAAWTAVRLSDLFYSRSRNVAWRNQWRTIVAVAVDIAGKIAGSDEGNMCERKQHVYYMFSILNDNPMCPFSDWKQFFDYAQSCFLRALEFDVLMATPEEYISECTHWLDGSNAARGLAARPNFEGPVAKMTAYMCLAIAHASESMTFTTLEIVGFSSYVATFPTRAAPQSAKVETPALALLWNQVSWTRSNKLGEILMKTVEHLSESMPNSTLASMFPEEHLKWVALTM